MKSASSSSNKTPAKSTQLAKGGKAVSPVKAVKPASVVKAVTVKKPVKPAAQPKPQAKKPVVAPKPVVARPPPAASAVKRKSEPVPKDKVVQAKVPAPKPVAPAAPKPVVAPAPIAAVNPLGVPVRSGRPSSRLAQLTVPSMAQSVASNAAKSSFTQMSSPQPIASPTAAAVKKDPKLANNWKHKSVADLTDEEVIAMPDLEYMNDTQIAFFRQKLVDLKDAILNNAGETTEHLREDTVVVPDPADRATIEEEHALELRTRDRERKLLKKIEQSINRIDAGDYGYCDETGEPIGVARLLARPTATLSLEAQQRRELKQKMFGD
ncbi:MAG: RNA polymerase-binding protein DksA [Rhodoferax sp.]|nr:RNA polymerase-binding protein DksA [Rhodoferax sp.]